MILALVEDKENGTEKDIQSISEVTLAKTEKLLGELLRLECSSSKEHPAGMSMEVNN